jgi:hypothetical protein
VERQARFDVAATRLADVIRDTPRAAFRSLVYLENEAVYGCSAVNTADSLLLYVGQPRTRTTNGGGSAVDLACRPSASTTRPGVLVETTSFQ